MPVISRIGYEWEETPENVGSKVEKILNFDFDHDDFEEPSCGYIADSEFSSTQQKTTVALAKNHLKFDDGDDFEQLLLILELMCCVNYLFDSLHKLINNECAHGILA